MKNQDYDNNSQFIPELKTEIICVISKMKFQLGQNVTETFNERTYICRTARGEHF